MKGYDTLSEDRPTAPPPYSPDHHVTTGVVHQLQPMRDPMTTPYVQPYTQPYNQPYGQPYPQPTIVHVARPAEFGNSVVLNTGRAHSRECCCCCCTCPFWVCALIIALIITTAIIASSLHR